jgi:hypothetical protein
MTVVYLDEDGKATGINGPWGELYTKMDSLVTPKVGMAPTLEFGEDFEDDKFFHVGEDEIAGHTSEEWNDLIKSMSASDFKKKYIDTMDTQTIFDVFACFDDATIAAFEKGLTD